MKIVSAGEVMIEISGQDGDAVRIGFGGDVFNTSVHLARLGRKVAFMTAIGDDVFSCDLLALCNREAVDTRLILTDSKRHCGLYAIRTDAAGERSFTYWRSDSAARGLFDLPGIDEAVADAATADLLIFSLITLAILPDRAREAMLYLADRVRQHGGHVAFDGNYRPLLWRDVAQARYWHGRALAVATIGLPTLDDEHALNGSCDAASVVEHWQRQGMSEVAVKLGAKGCLTNDGLMVTPPHIVQPVDTSGAGDAFNAGYLHARLGGAPCDRAAAAGHRLAGWVIGRRGAVPSPDAQAPYAALRDLAD